MSRFFLKKLLSTGKTSILEELFNARADELASDKFNPTIENTGSFLDITDEVKDMDLKARLISRYFKDEDIMGEECGRLIKKYYSSRFFWRSKFNYRM